jgi:hypothetical protein
MLSAQRQIYDSEKENDMFFTESFSLQLDDLLDRIGEKLQISPTQHRLAEERYKTIGQWLEANESLLAPFNPVIYPQGSLRIGTTVRPRGRQEYDLDLVCRLLINWCSIANPVTLLDAVEHRLRQHDIYKNMLERKNRCIRLNYANEFHLDILPACPDVVCCPTCVVVPDRDAKEWRASNPKGYATWFESRQNLLKAMITERVEPLPGHEPFEVKATLQRVVQLVKRWRDITYAKNFDLAPVSIVLTTLTAQHYSGERSVNEALTNVLDGIVASLSANGKGRLIVLNPTNPREDLSERWNEVPDAYSAFVSGIISFRKAWNNITQQYGIPSVSAGLTALFGEEITKSVVTEQAETIEKFRREKKLAVQRSSGILAATTSPSSHPIKPNTFHGS